MKTSLMLKEERASMISDLEALVDTAKTEEREFTQDEEARQADLNESIFALDEKIANAEKSESIMARSMAGAASKSEEREMAEHAKNYSLQDAIAQFRSGGRLTGREAEMQQEAQNEFRQAGISPTGHIQIPMGLTYRGSGDVSAFAATTGTAEQTVLQGLVPESIIERAGANRITGVAGTVRLPSLPNDGTSLTTEENPIDPGSEMQAVDIAPVRIASRIDVSNQMLAASTNSFDSAVAAQFRKHSGGLLDKQAFTNFLANGTKVLRSETSPGDNADCLGLSFTVANDLIGSMGDADALNDSLAFFSSHGQMAVARVKEAVANSGIPMLGADGKIAGYSAYGHSQISAALVTDTDVEDNEDIYDNGTNGHTVTNPGDILPFYAVNMNDVYCCYWGGADLIVDNVTQAHAGLTRLIMNYYANCKVGHAASARFSYVK